MKYYPFFTTRPILAALGLFVAMTPPVLAGLRDSGSPGPTDGPPVSDSRSPIVVDGNPPPFCATRVCGLRTVNAHETVFDYEATAVSAEVECPKGTAPVGGGAAATGGYVEQVHLTASRPLFPHDPNTGDEDFDAAPIGWYALMGKPRPTNTWPSIDVWAICIPVQ